MTIKRYQIDEKLTGTWTFLHPEAIKAHRLVQYAVRNGLIKKPKKCQDCGLIPRRIYGHHEDYSKPLDVVWVCGSCHRKRHGSLRPTITVIY